MYHVARYAHLTPLLPDDLVWQHRGRWWRELADQLGVSRHHVAKNLRWRGYVCRRGSPRLAQAPCARCGDTFRVRDEQTERLCVRCEALRAATTEPQWRKDYDYGLAIARKHRDKRYRIARAELDALHAQWNSNAA